MAKGKKTGGRKQGTPNKSTAERSRRRGLKQSYSIRTITMAIAIIQRSCSDSLLTASPMDGVFGSDRPAKLQKFLPRSMPSINNLPGGHRGEVSYVVPRSEDIDLKKCSACW